MLNKIKLYIGYWLIMLSYYKYRKVFAHDWLILKETFKVISHPDDYGECTVATHYDMFVTTNTVLRKKVELFKRNGL